MFIGKRVRLHVRVLHFELFLYELLDTAAITVKIVPPMMSSR